MKHHILISVEPKETLMSHYHYIYFKLKTDI